MGKNRKKNKGNNNLLDKVNHKVGNVHNEETDTNDTSLSITDDSTVDKKVQESIAIDEVQGTVGKDKESVSVAPQEKLTFFQKLGLRIAKPVFEKIKAEICKLEEKMLQLEGKNKGYESRLNKLGGFLSGYEDKIRNLEENNSALNSALKAETDKLNQEEGKHKEIKKKLLNKIEELKKQNDSIKQPNTHTYEMVFLDKLKSHFADFIENGMTTDEAIKIISQRIKSLDEVAKQAEKKVSELTKAIESEKREKEEAITDAQNKQSVAEIRINQIESSDKGRLTQQIKDLKIQLETKEKRIDTLTTEITKTENDNETLKGEKANLEKQLEDSKKRSMELEILHEKEIINLKKTNQDTITERDKENREKIDKLQANHDGVVKELKDKHKKEEETIKKQNEEEKEKIISSHKEEIDKIQDAHKKEMDRMQTGFYEKENSLKETIDSQKKEIYSLQKKMNSECEALKKISVDAVENLFEIIKNHDIMAACSDDYINNVEEKNQELLVGAKKLKNKISELPPTITPSQWTAQLSDVICKLFEDNGSFICKLLKYYAMSNVPCMIDSKREEGIYFIRKNISLVHDTLAILLTQCGITPIIPAIFVENIHESEYEVEGSFNDIEAFCPGSVNEHIEHIERDSEELEEIIVGITKVGYKSADGKIMKAQVLIK